MADHFVRVPLSDLRAIRRLPDGSTLMIVYDPIKSLTPYKLVKDYGHYGGVMECVMAYKYLDTAYQKYLEYKD